ncbi:hypothetical protein PLESTB_001819800 [Pleodorina starrii]|uniref:J domain-containing protein n=1 Tax=Pleodorina starrii TaxID=330485 RepID=A0A9W6FAQ1_9CHLO|nr:hypothetical protein PLESTB_001819800 [Pleodorina starrii]GLC76703.1 hypothetical protein PLESTF_001820300 [Pleodorina starrii]
MRINLYSKTAEVADDVRDEGLLDQQDGREGRVASSSPPGRSAGSPSSSHSSGFNSTILTQSPEDALSAMFDERVSLLASTLENVRSKCELLQEQLTESGAVCSSYAARLARSEDSVRRLKVDSEHWKERERQLHHDGTRNPGELWPPPVTSAVVPPQVTRLEALLEASRLQATFVEARHQAALAEERVRSERLRAMRDDALQQRDNALSELSGCYADVDALQATLADSALYVRYLRKRLLELELLAARQQQQPPPQQQQQTGSADKGGGGGVFSLASIRTAIQTAVAEAAQCGEEERRKRIRQLQLRWHPDKNPVLTEFATEVTKMINEAVAEMERAGGA